MKPWILIVLMTGLLSYLSVSHAAYFSSDNFINDNTDAIGICPETCGTRMLQWTGRWWQDSDRDAVCECFHDWPFCPVVDEPPPERPCIFTQ